MFKFILIVVLDYFHLSFNLLVIICSFIFIFKHSINILKGVNPTDNFASSDVDDIDEDVLVVLTGLRVSF